MEKRMPAEAASDVHPVGRKDQLGIILWVTLILVMAGMVIMVGSNGWGQSIGQESRRGYQAGQVTGRQGNSIQIDKKDYAVDESVTIEDDEERPRELKDIKEGSEVQFHVRRDKIDKIILILPR